MKDSIRQGFELARNVQDASSDDAAFEVILTVCRDLVHATRAHLFTLDAARKPILARSTDDPSDEELALALKAVEDALGRHKRKEELAALTATNASELETDETTELSLVAKVIACELRPLAVAVIVKESARHFTEDERRFFSSLCLNAASGLARRRAFLTPRGATVQHEKSVADAVHKVKTAVIKVPRRYFEHPVAGLLGKSPAVVHVRELCYRYAAARPNLCVLIRGESGTGKELFARGIHDLSDRKSKPYVPLNCAGLAESLVGNELFGHTRGAFTGADKEAKGFLRDAHGGSIFFDEVGDIPLAMQTALLRVLETRKVQPVGGGAPVDVDIRVIAATNQDLEELMAQGKFREELYQRLNVLDVFLPPLRERREDLLLLAQHFLVDEAKAAKVEATFSPAAVEWLESYEWPGNVRELKNSVARALVLASSGRGTAVIEPRHLGRPEARSVRAVGAAPAPAPSSAVATLDEDDASKRAAIVAALSEHEGNQVRAAAALNVHRNTLRREMKRLGIGISYT